MDGLNSNDFSADTSSERSRNLSSHSSDEISIGYQDEFVPFRPLDGQDLSKDPGNREGAHSRDNRIEKPLAVMPPLPSLPWEMSGYIDVGDGCWRPNVLVPSL